MSFAVLADRFLSHSKVTNEPETFHVHKHFLQSFIDHIGKTRAVSRLGEDDLDAWCRLHAAGGGWVKAGGKKGGFRTAKPWSENAQVPARAIVLAALNYGVKKLNLPPHGASTCSARKHHQP